jgi:hypothetical protein
MATDREWWSEIRATLADTSTASRTAGSIVHAIYALLTGQQSGTSQGPNGAPPVSARWTVHSSSISTSAGASDLWGATYNAAKIVRANTGVARSWICLVSPNTMPGGSKYLVIDYVGTNDNNIRFYWSEAAPTGAGTTTAIPTFASLQAANPSPFGINDLVAASYYVSMCISANGSFYIAWRKTTDTWVRGAQWLVNLDGVDETDTHQILAGGEFATASPGCFSDGYATASGLGLSAITKDAVHVFQATNANVHAGFTHLASGTTSNRKSQLVTAKISNRVFGSKIPIFMYPTGSGYLYEYKGYLPDALHVGLPEAIGSASPNTGSVEYCQAGAWRLPFGGAI